MTIRTASADDAEQIASLYNHFVENSVVSFEEAPLATAEMRDRIKNIQRTHEWFVAEEDGSVLGFSYAAPWHGRAAYRFTAEATIYIAQESLGRGVGTLLYEALLLDLRDRGMHVAMGVIALPNSASVALHERFGFEKVGQFRSVGRKFDRWIDVGYWQLVL